MDLKAQNNQSLN